MNKLYFALAMAVLLGSGCGAAKKTAQTPVAEITLPEMVVNLAPEPVYNASYAHSSDILHTALDIKLDWKKQYVYGEATIKARPWFYATDKLELDAKGFEIKETSLIKNGQRQKINYAYDNAKLILDLDKTYKRDEEYTVYIGYTAKPNEIKVKGSAAIKEDKGFYFIDPLDADKEKPRQFWTQGETESNSCWFPTVDKPNERCSGEITLTVEDDFITLSNGLLLSSKKNADGTRTDHWKQELPIAPYLFMVAGGEYTVVKDKWRDKEVNYYVEPAYAPYAQRMWGNTPEMIEFFSTKLGVTYPWAKYAQIVLRDYVSGAMENVSAVTFFESMNKTEREMIDEDHEDIIAHELFHHWFGDLVTCESWANLPLNESFATYGEYLWIEHKYGKDAADEHIRADMDQYLMESKQKKEPLIRYYYDDKEDMFDAHSYQKGGRVLHMLRQIVGDDAFFASLKKYLEDNKYTDVEIDELRMAFEDVTGRDYHWFFDQWFMRQGHPVLDISYGKDEPTGRPTVTVKQTQEEEPFILPLQVEIYGPKGKKTSSLVTFKGREDTHILNWDGPYELINVDADKALVCQKEDHKQAAEYAYQYYHAPHYMDKLESIKFLEKLQDRDADARRVMTDALEAPFWDIRSAAIRGLTLQATQDDYKGLTKTLKKIAGTDKHPKVRTAALNKLGGLKDKEYTDLFQEALKDSSYAVVASALTALGDVDGEKSLRAAKKLESEKSNKVISAIAQVYGSAGDEKETGFFTKNLETSSSGLRYQLCTPYADFLKRMDGKTLDKGINQLSDIAQNDKTWWVRYAAAKGIKRLKEGLEDKKARLADNDSRKASDLDKVISSLAELITTIKAKETNEELKKMYMGW